MVLKGKPMRIGRIVLAALVIAALLVGCSNPLVGAVVAVQGAAAWSRVIASPATGVVANHAVTLSWPETPGAASYNLYWSTSPSPTKTTATKMEGVSSPYVHSGLSNGLDYYYFLTAIIPEGESKSSAVTQATPMQTVVYVNSYNRVNIYPVDNTTGALGALIDGPNLGLGQISSIAVDTARKYAYLADRGYAKVYSFEINSDTGTLSEAGSPVSTGISSFPSYVVIDSGSGYVYVVNSGTKNIMGYRVNPLDGSLTDLATAFPVALADEQINGVSISPDRPFIYFSTYDFTSSKGHIYSNSINTSTGGLSLIGLPTETPCFPGPISFGLTGDYLYVANHSACTDSVDLYSYSIISSTGVLSTRTSNSINTVSSLRNISNSGLATDPLGRFLFVGNGLADPSITETSLTVLKISNGALSIVPVLGKDSLSIPYDPGCMAVDTNGHCLYVVNGSKIESYSINQMSGALTWLATTETLAAGDNTDLGYYLIRDITVASLP